MRKAVLRQESRLNGEDAAALATNENAELLKQAGFAPWPRTSRKRFHRQQAGKDRGLVASTHASAPHWQQTTDNRQLFVSSFLPAHLRRASSARQPTTDNRQLPLTLTTASTRTIIEGSRRSFHPPTRQKPFCAKRARSTRERRGCIATNENPELHTSRLRRNPSTDTDTGTDNYCSLGLTTY